MRPEQPIVKKGEISKRLVSGNNPYCINSHLYNACNTNILQTEYYVTNKDGSCKRFGIGTISYI